MDVPAYLNRIRYDRLLEPTVNTLCALHRQHMPTVPFENLDIHHRRGDQIYYN
ncbi:MAG TPA: arylamine N-acetyltransferase [Terriglobia bacterium]|nr:arylamine N-acetyltransferase [Terriglobia bacterium]